MEDADHNFKAVSLFSSFQQQVQKVAGQTIHSEWFHGKEEWIVIYQQLIVSYEMHVIGAYKCTVQ